MDSQQNDNLWEKVSTAQTELRDDCRIKINTDYAVIVKYSKVHVLCHSVYEDSIRGCFMSHGISIETLNTYN